MVLGYTCVSIHDFFSFYSQWSQSHYYQCDQQHKVKAGSQFCFSLAARLEYLSIFYQPEYFKPIMLEKEEGMWINQCFLAPVMMSWVMLRWLLESKHFAVFQEQRGAGEVTPRSSSIQDQLPHNGKTLHSEPAGVEQCFILLLLFFLYNLSSHKLALWDDWRARR